MEKLAKITEYRESWGWGSMKFFFMFLAVCTVNGFAESADNTDIQSLLNDADSALKEPAAKPEAAKTEKSPHKKKKKIAVNDEDSDYTPSPPLVEAPKPATPEGPPKIVPIDSPDLKEILSVDLDAKARERSRRFPKSVVRLLGGMNWMGGGYTLIRGDDSFEKIDGGALAGVYVEYNPVWALGLWGPSVAEASISLSLGAGYFRGNALMRRTGVQTGDTTYPLNSTPLNVEVGPVLSLWNRVALQLGYGASGEFIHQMGEGETDTVTQLVWADTASAAIRAYLSDSFEWYVGCRYRGVSLGSNPHIHATMLMSGIGFQFLD
jgi:hypothetical protein